MTAPTPILRRNQAGPRNLATIVFNRLTGGSSMLMLIYRHLPKLTVLQVLFATLFALPAFGQVWLDRYPPNNPPAPAFAAAAYDAARKEVVLFGGIIGG